MINTCGFIHDAREESVNYILDALQAKEEGRLGEVLVMGCLSERYKKNWKRKCPVWMLSLA